ncbi:MAG: hypothetical protein ABW166_18150 [Sedimenticola sp.]
MKKKHPKRIPRTFMNIPTNGGSVKTVRSIACVKEIPAKGKDPSLDVVTSYLCLGIGDIDISIEFDSLNEMECFCEVHNFPYKLLKV